MDSELRQILISNVEPSKSLNQLSLGEIFGVIGVIVLQLATAAFFYLVMLVLSFNSDSCYGSGSCDDVMAGVSFYLIPIAAGIAFVLSLAWSFLEALRGGSVFLGPVIGIVIVVLAGVVSIVLNLGAFS